MQQQNKIRAKSYSALFLLIILLYLAAEIFINIISERYTLPMWLSLVISESIILIPGFIWMLVHNVSFRDGLGFNKIKAGTIGMSVVLAYLLMPLVTLVNLVSQLFTTNTLLGVSSEVISGNVLVMIFLMGFFGPFCEEVVFRGILGRGMSRVGTMLSAAIVSGLYFGLMHMNLNQFCYAFVLGIIFSIVNYASGSIYTSMIMHTVVNTHNVLLLLLTNKFISLLGDGMSGESLAEATETVRSSGIIYYSIGLYIILSLIFTAIAIPVFAFIARNEGNSDIYMRIFKPSKRTNLEESAENSKIWWLNAYSVIAVLLCVVVIFFLEKILTILGL